MSAEQELQRIGEEILALISQQAIWVGEDLVEDLESVASYAGARARLLAIGVNEPGFDQAVRAERDSLLLMAAVRSTDRADEVDARVRDVAERALRLAAVTLRGVVSMRAGL